MSALKIMKQQNEKDEDANVTWVDQNNINQFSKCNASWSDLESQYETLTKEKEYLDDLSGELDLLDDETVQYKIGDAFISLTIEEAQERVVSQQDSINTQCDSVKGEMEDVKCEMEKLKVLLYAKFGKSINLER